MSRKRANGRAVRRGLGDKGVIFPNRVVVAIEEHSIEGIFVIGMVIEFPDSVVARVHSRKGAQETVRCTHIRKYLSSIVDTGADSAGWRCSHCASSQFLAYRAYRNWRARRGKRQRINRVYHAARRVSGCSIPINVSLRGRRRNPDAADESDEGTQTFIPTEEEELVLLDRPTTRRPRTASTAPASEGTVHSK